MTYFAKPCSVDERITVEVWNGQTGEWFRIADFDDLDQANVYARFHQHEDECEGRDCVSYRVVKEEILTIGAKA